MIFEFLTLGNAVKVSAVDMRTGIEVAVVAPAGAARCDLERLAGAKLARRLAREQG